MSQRILPIALFVIVTGTFGATVYAMPDDYRLARFIIACVLAFVLSFCLWPIVCIMTGDWDTPAEHDPLDDDDPCAPAVVSIPFGGLDYNAEFTDGGLLFRKIGPTCALCIRLDTIHDFTPTHRVQPCPPTSPSSPASQLS